jgi:hypothetical protein
MILSSPATPETVVFNSSMSIPEMVVRLAFFLLLAFIVWAWLHRPHRD